MTKTWQMEDQRPYTSYLCNIMKTIYHRPDLLQLEQWEDLFTFFHTAPDDTALTSECCIVGGSLHMSAIS